MLPVANDQLVQFRETPFINQPPSDRSLAANLDPFRRQSNDVPGFCEQDPFPGNACLEGQPGMMEELPELSVNRNKKSWPGQVDHQLQFFLAPMAGDVHSPPGFVVHGRTPIAEEVYDVRKPPPPPPGQFQSYLDPGNAGGRASYDDLALA